VGEFFPVIGGGEGHGNPNSVVEGRNHSGENLFGGETDCESFGEQGDHTRYTTTGIEDVRDAHIQSAGR
jgi:hypothetical protein